MPAVGAAGADGSDKLAVTPVAEVHAPTVICKLGYVPAGAVIVAVPPVTETFVKLLEV